MSYALEGLNLRYTLTVSIDHTHRLYTVYIYIFCVCSFLELVRLTYLSFLNLLLLNLVQDIHCHVFWYTSAALWWSKSTESFFSTVCGCAYCFWCWWWLHSLAPPLLSSSPPCLSQYLLRLSLMASSSCTRIAANSPQLRSPDNAVDDVGRWLFVVDCGSSPSCIALEDECVCQRDQEFTPHWKLELALGWPQKTHTHTQTHPGTMRDDTEGCRLWWKTWGTVVLNVHGF